MDLSRKRDRAALKVRREPHWQKLAKGAYLGYRRGAETWHARYRDAKGKQHWYPLEGITPDDFDGAKQEAEKWLATFAGAAVRSPKRATVKAALEAYLAHLRRHGRPDTATEAEGRFKLTVWQDEIADLSLESAKKDDFREWRDRLTKGRQPRSVNRQYRAVAAGLERAVSDCGYIGNPDAWRIEPLPDSTEDEGDTAVFLDSEQRKALIAAAPQRASEFLRGLELTGARPKELAEACVRDFDGKTLKLSHKKGRPPKTRVRYVYLDAVAVAFFDGLAKDKLPGACLFTEDGETPWRRHVWAREVRAAIATANKDLKGKHRIPVENKEKGEPGATAYSFRHARISELLQVHGVDPLTVAQQCGTSLAMIEKAYLRFIPSAMAEKLAQVRA